VGAAVQSLAFEWKRSRRAAWVFVTVVGIVFGVLARSLVLTLDHYLRTTIHPWLLFFDHNPLLFSFGVGVVFSSGIGLFQTLLLARQSRRAILWIPVSAICILVCSNITDASPHFIFGRQVNAWFYAGRLIMGGIYGVMTVIPLEWILRPRVLEGKLPVGS
jgi:hypothetical protein